MPMRHALWTTALLLVAGAHAGPAQTAATLKVDESATRLTFPGDHFQLALTILSAISSPSAHLSAELVDAEDEVRSIGEASCTLLSSPSVCTVELPPAIPDKRRTSRDPDHLPQFRIRYTVSAPGAAISGIQAVDHIAPDLFELHIAVPEHIHRGGSYVARVRALHPLTHQPLAAVALKATVTADAEDSDAATVSEQQLITDAEGFVSVPFTVPAGKDLNSVELDVEGTLANLHPSLSQTLTIPENARFDLTTDKPLYQPGQTVHTRLLLLDRNGRAAAQQPVRLSVNDPNSILLYRAEATTSTYGIATVDWPIPARLRLGQYSLKAELVGDSESQQSAYANIRISRYDLPTFVVVPTPDRPYYLPGNSETAKVTVRANYLFGKPVLKGKVRVVREDDRTWNFAEQRYDTKEGEAISGELNADGSFTAEIPLAQDLKQFDRDPPYSQFEDLHLAAYVTDASTGRTEERRFDLRVAARAIQLYITADRQAARLPLRYFVSATTAEGNPVRCRVAVSLLPPEKDDDTLKRRISEAHPLLQVSTNAHGLARIDLPEYQALHKLLPANTSKSDPEEAPSLYVAATDEQERTGEATEQVQQPTENLRLTTNQSIYHPGDPVEICLESSLPSAPLTVEVLRHTRQGDLTLATREVTLQNGRATMTIPTDNRFTGFVFIQAIAIGPAARETEAYSSDNDSNDERASLASRAILFPRDNALHVGIQMSAASYAPGAEAVAALTVKGPQDPDGDETTPTPSALGIVAVDQAVTERNRTDSDFGDANTQPFFFQWLSEFPGASAAGGYTLDTLERLDLAQPIPPEAQLAAELLMDRLTLAFATTDNAPSSDLANLYQNFLFKQLFPARTALTAYTGSHGETPTTEPGLAALLAEKGIDFPSLRDPWGMPYTLIAQAENRGVLTLRLRSAGPDKLQGTPDDFETPLAGWRWFAVRDKQLQQAIYAYHQRNGGYVRSLSNLHDELHSEGIDFEAWRDPWGQPFTYKFEIEQTRFVVEAISAGDPSSKPRYDWEKGPYIIGNAQIDYTADMRKRIGAALNAYAESHRYPTDPAGFRAALHAAGIATPATAGLLTDPWHHPLRVTFRAHSFFADRVHTEAHATPASAPQTRTTITPVTAVADVVDLHSAGPDGKWSTPDDFVLASFSRTRSLESAQDNVPRRPAQQSVHSGATGDIAGVLTDQSGAVIGGAVVLATRGKSGDEFESKSDRQGRYLIGPVPVGTYTVRFSMPGFTDLIYDEVVVAVNNTVELNAQLQVGSVAETVEVTAPAPMLQTDSAMVISSQQLSALPLMKIAPGVAASPNTSTPRLRDYFPETLLWRPEILTAPDGTATLRFPVADSITNWQLSAAASTLQGNTGAGTAEFRSFQPFFAAFDPPSVLTVGDTVALPIPLRNYLDHELTVRTSIAPTSWFRLDGQTDSVTKVASQDSASPLFRFTALSPVANAKQEFTAQAGETGDRIARQVTVHPDGQESAVTAAAILTPGDNTMTLMLPEGTLAASTDTTLKIYPNLAAHIRDAILAIDRYQGACGEQIVSGAWPSLLLQRYAAAIPQKDDALLRNTHQALETAYQSLLANQQPSGGFGYWPKDTSPDLALTAYIVQFLTQARQFIAVDDRVIVNAVAYLATQQSKAKETEGRWIRVDRSGQAHPEDTHADIMLTASIAAMIVAAPNAEPLVEKALAATESFAREFDEPYTLANYALAALAVKDAKRSAPAIERLRGMALSEHGGAYWNLETNTPFFGWGRAGRVETTAQVLRALLASGATPQANSNQDDLITRGLLFLDHEQDRQALWYSTQATARALDVMAEIAMRAPIETAFNGGVLKVQVAGQPALRVPLPNGGQDAGPIFVPLGSVLGAGEHQVRLALPKGAQPATAQLISSFYQKWPEAQPAGVANNERLELAVSYSSTRPASGASVDVSAHVERVGFHGYGMMIAEIGLPPGAEVDRASLESAMTESDWQISHYEVLPDKVQIYLWPRAGGLSLHFRFSLRYGIDARTAPSLVYDYYNPDARADVEPVRFNTF